MRYTQNSPIITYIEVLTFICKKNWVNWSKNHRAMTIFVPPQRNSWKSSFRPDWPNFENFKLGPRAQFLANRPNSFFVDHIDTRSLGGIHHWASRGTAGRELRSGQIPPPPALNKLDQRPLYIGLNQLNLCFRLVPFMHFGSSIRQLFINRLQEVPSRTFSPFRASSSETSSPPCIRTSSNLFSTLLWPGTPNFHFVIRSLQMYLHLVEVLMSPVSAFHPIL